MLIIETISTDQFICTTELRPVSCAMLKSLKLLMILLGLRSHSSVVERGNDLKPDDQQS